VASVAKEKGAEVVTAAKEAKRAATPMVQSAGKAIGAKAQELERAVRTRT